MSIKKHPDYEYERNRLEETLKYVETTLEVTEGVRTMSLSRMIEAMEDPDREESSDAYMSILLNTQFIEAADKNYDGLIKAKEKPYFARIDFKSDESDVIEKMYLGKTSLYRAEDELPLIIDWRAPVASVYYEGRLGEVTYETDFGTEAGELFLKRQYTINSGELKEIMDIDITANDTFLQAALNDNKDNRLKDIASTIQAEQNRVIRAPLIKPLVVQGAAGSGKTTIALHRIAYLIYTYEESFDPEQFMIMAPNKLFINYISDVLPELGVEKVKQTTFIDFMNQILEKKFKIQDKDEKLMQIITDKESEDIKNIINESEFKGSLEFKRALERYVSDIEKKFVPREDFSLLGEIVVSYEEINTIFLRDMTHISFENRKKDIKVRVRKRLKDFKKDMIEKTENYYNFKIDKIRKDEEPTEERRLKLVKLIDARDEKIKEIEKEARTLVDKYMRKYPKTKLMDYYEEFIGDVDNLNKYLKSENVDKYNLNYISKNSMEIINSKKIQLEDYAALAYIKFKIFGFKKKVDVRNVIIDEAQDFSLMQFAVLREILNTDMITLLGDLSQGIHSYRGTKNWEEVLSEVFKDRGHFMTLVQSYRTTIEIMDLANEIIKHIKTENLTPAKPVIRHGGKPERHIFREEKLLLKSLEKGVKESQKLGHQSIAVIGKTVEECKKIQKHFNKAKIVCNMLDGKNEEYLGGVTIVPSHLSKGLEFDSVFIAAIDERYHKDVLDLKLLYVAVTRTLHRLCVYQMEDTIDVFEDIKEQYFE